MKKVLQNKKFEYDVIIVGAGPAGLGIGIVLEQLGVNYIILEKDSVGSSFRKWPKETRFISPSFTGNFFKMVDLNAITPDTSPAFYLRTEHPTGTDYAKYLVSVSKFFELNVKTRVNVKEIEKNEKSFIIKTNNNEYKSEFVIWAAGEYQYPKKESFKGYEHCTHYSQVKSFSDLEGEKKVIIGSYESGFDAAVNLSELGKKVLLLDSSDYLHLVNSDSSYSLSPFTRDRIENAINDIRYHKKTSVKEVKFENNQYTIKTSNNKTFNSKTKPINCTGFATSLSLVEDLFDFDEGYPLLNDFDESQKTKNLFLVGPQVKHGSALFCFIYKYRQRFAIVAEKIAKIKKIDQKKIKDVIQEYKDYNFYLDDLSCCDDECVC